jgi:hypothetical protein
MTEDLIAFNDTCVPDHTIEMRTAGSFSSPAVWTRLPLSVRIRLGTSALVLLSATACTSATVTSAATRGPASSTLPPDSAVSASLASGPAGNPVAYSWCGEVTVQARLPDGVSDTFRSGQLAHLAVQVGQDFTLAATSRCGMAFQVAGLNVIPTPGSEWQMAFAGVPGLPSGVTLASPTYQNPLETVNGSLTALTAGTSSIAVEVDVPAQTGGYIEPVTITVVVTP